MRVINFFKKYWKDKFGGIERKINEIEKGVEEKGIE